MRRAVISTVGTSLVTNDASPELRSLLNRTANLQEAQYAVADFEVVQERVAEVEARLKAAKDDEVRRMSAELNGLLALDSVNSRSDHYLLCSDTFQGRETTRLVAAWLRDRGCNVVPCVLDRFSTANRAAFASGIDSLLQWAEGTLPTLREQGYHIIFNLVGSFKSLQAYAQTLGMFYADEIVYLFDDKSAELIRIPRLPITWDRGALERSANVVARLALGDVVSRSQVAELPEAYLDIDEADHVTLSEWGRMAWTLHRKEILSGSLLEQSGLVYSDELRRDYQRWKDSSQHVALQEALAQAAIAWQRGGLQSLRADHGLRYEDYSNLPGIGHFRVNDDLRVSCERRDNQLWLRHFGPHNYVNNNP